MLHGGGLSVGVFDVEFCVYTGIVSYTWLCVTVLMNVLMRVLMLLPVLLYVENSMSSNLLQFKVTQSSRDSRFKLEW